MFNDNEKISSILSFCVPSLPSSLPPHITALKSKESFLSLMLTTKINPVPNSWHVPKRYSQDLQKLFIQN